MSVTEVFNSIKVGTWWSLSGLFDITPGYTWRFQYVYAGLTIACLVGAIVVAFLKIRPGLKARLSSLLWTNALLGIVLYFARAQRIPYIGTDLVRFIQEAILVFWVNSIVLYSRTKLRKEVVAEKAQERFEKYLPKQKA